MLPMDICLTNSCNLHLIEPRATSAGGSDHVVEDVPSIGKLFNKWFKGNTDYSFAD
jgi:hypothetical protein